MSDRRPVRVYGILARDAHVSHCGYDGRYGLPGEMGDWSVDMEEGLRVLLLMLATQAVRTR